MLSLAYAALWIFVFAIPWEILAAGDGVSISTKLTGVVALGCAAFAALLTGRLRRWHLFHVAALLFLVWAGAGLLVQQGGEITKKYLTFVQLGAMAWMIWELASSRARQVGLLAAFVLGTYVTAFGTLAVYRTAARGMHRFAAGGADPNYTAMTLALALPMAWYLGMTCRPPLLRWVFRAYLPLGLLAIVLTGSRGGMLATMVALMIIPLTMTRLTPGRLATAIGLLGISGALAIKYTPDTLVERLGSTGTEVEAWHLGGRAAIWVAGLHAFTERPLMGYGAGTFKVAVRRWGEGQVAHNSYISVLVEEGLIGFLLWATMLLAVFAAILRLPLLERRFALVLMATLGVAMIPLTWEDGKAVWFVLTALLGLAQTHIASTRGAARRPGPSQPALTGRQALAERPPAAAAWSGQPTHGEPSP